MFTSLQLPFLRALGYAIANSLWQLFLLWLVVIIINGFAKHSPNIKYITAVVAQVSGFVWFVSTLQYYYQSCCAASVQTVQFLSQHETAYTQSFTVNAGIATYWLKMEATLPYLSVAYLFLLLLIFIKWLAAFRLTKQLRTVGLQPANAMWQRFVAETADRLQIVQHVAVYLSSLAKSPMTIGYIKPIILLPLASVNQLTTEQMEAVLLHELAHIRRSDYLIHFGVSIIEIILFFNPFTRLLSQQIVAERENCCDDWVLQSKYDAAMYAEALLHIAYHNINARTGWEMNAVSAKKSVLLQRIKRMIEPKTTLPYRHQIVALFLTTGLLFSLAMLQPASHRFGKPTAGNITTVTKKRLPLPQQTAANTALPNAASLFAQTLKSGVVKSLAETKKTITDSVTKTSVQTAQKAVEKIMPDVMATLTSSNLKKGMNDAKNEAAKSLTTLNTQRFQSDANELSDSFLFDKKAKQLWEDDSRENVAAARNMLLNLVNAKLKFTVNNKLLQQISGDALAALQQVDFKAMADSINLSFDALHTLVLQPQLQNESLRKKQREGIKKRQPNLPEFIQLLPPPPPPHIEVAANNNQDEIRAANFLYQLPQVPTSNIFSQPLFLPASHHDGTAKTIRIISNTDSVNIIIEIRQ